MKESIVQVKKRILTCAYESGKSVHLGGSLSMVDVLTILYKEIMRYDATHPEWPQRDRFILSKGHCAIALYAVLAECGFITDEKMKTFMQDGTELVTHPVMNANLGIESSNGSLGQGMSMGIGMAKAAKIKGEDYQVYVMVGNGECNEGSVWEAAMLAASWKLDNLTVLVDQNHMQNDGYSKDVMPVENLQERFESFGFFTQEISGHDIEKIRVAFSKREVGRPRVIIANTVKGHGVSFMEDNAEWHHNRLTKINYETAMQELEDSI